MTVSATPPATNSLGTRHPAKATGRALPVASTDNYSELQLARIEYRPPLPDVLKGAHFVPETLAMHPKDNDADRLRIFLTLFYQDCTRT